MQFTPAHFLLLGFLSLISSTAYAGGGEHDPFAPILFVISCIIIAAIIGRWLATRYQQASVLGELLIGMIIGNIGYWFGSDLFLFIMHLDIVNQVLTLTWEQGLNVQQALAQLFTPEQLNSSVGQAFSRIFASQGASELLLIKLSIWIFSSLGVILLLFMVGLESSVTEMKQVGKTSMLVALVGVVAPFSLGLLVSEVLLSDSPLIVHLFIASTLTATSVGITARVFKDLRQIHRPEVRIILGAAVIDDILGLVVLAIIVGIVTTGSLNIGAITQIFIVSLAFLGILLTVGEKVIHAILLKTSRYDPEHSRLLYPILLAFLLSWLASAIGLSAIVGAFAAGLLLKEEHFAHVPASPHGHTLSLRESFEPFEKVFAPIFFVLMGMQVNLATLFQSDAILLSLSLIIVALIGKAVAGFVVSAPLNRWVIGVGMIPRGEVGLIFASIGKSLGVLPESVFSAIVLMVIVTTFVTPMALKVVLSRIEKQAETN